MSHTDQAFIKAFGQQKAPSAAQPPRVEVQPATFVDPPVRAAQPSGGAASARGSGVVPPPKGDFFGLRATPAKEKYAADTSAPVVATIVAEPATTEKTAAEKQIAGKASAQKQTAEQVAPAAVLQAPLQAAFEVPEFAWPQIVEQLAAEAAEGFRQASATLRAACKTGSRCILVTGCCRGEGRSTLALTLARRLASDGARVVVADLDMERPALAAQLGIAPQFGAEEVLSGSVPLADALVESTRDRLTVLPLRTTGRFSAEKTTAWGKAIAQLRTSYDLVLLDAGPVSDALLQLGSGTIDAAVVLRDVRRVSATELAAVGRRLEQAGIECWESVENFAS